MISLDFSADIETKTWYVSTIKIQTQTLRKSNFPKFCKQWSTNSEIYDKVKWLLDIIKLSI